MPRPLSPADARILALESDRIAGHTVKVLTLAPGEDGRPVSVAALRERIAARAPELTLATERLAGAPSGLAWVRDEAFDAAAHVGETLLGRPGAPADTGEAVARALASRLDRSRPLWRVDALHPPQGGGTALVWQIHHALADGSTALRLIQALVGDGTRHGEEQGAEDGARGGRTDHLPLWARQPANSVRLRVIGLPRLIPALRREAWPPARRTLFAETCGPSRRAAVARAPVQTLRRIGHATGAGATVNDVLLAAVAGGVRAWASQRARRPHDIRAQVPVSMHARDEDMAAAANSDSFMRVWLPVAETDPVRRLERVAAQTRERKRHHDAQLLFTFVGDVERAPVLRRLVDAGLETPQAYAFSVSNMRGPSDLGSVLGHAVTGLETFAEIGVRHALRVSAVSFAGTLTVGLTADATALPDLDVLASGIEAEIDALAARLG